MLGDAERALVLEFGGKQLRKEQLAARMKLLRHPRGLLRYVQPLSPIWNSPYELDANEPFPDANKAYLDAKKDLDAKKTYLDAKWAAFQARKIYLDAEGRPYSEHFLHELRGFRQAKQAYGNSLEEYSKSGRAYWDKRKASRVVPFTGRHFLKGSVSKTTASINTSPSEKGIEAKWNRTSKAILNVASVNRDMRQRMARLHEADMTLCISKGARMAEKMFRNERKKRILKKKNAEARKRATERRLNTPYE